MTPKVKASQFQFFRSFGYVSQFRFDFLSWPGIALPRKGNDFLSNIRECDAIIHVVRCFDNDDIVHSMGKVDPVRDIGVIETELILADIQSAEQQLDRNQ